MYTHYTVTYRHTVLQVFGPYSLVHLPYSMDIPTTNTALCLMILAIIVTATLSLVSADSCPDLRKGQGAALSNTFGCTDTVCDEGYLGYHVILHGNQKRPREQRVEVNVQSGCDKKDTKYVLVLMSQFPVTWVFNGFIPRVVYLVGEGELSETTAQLELDQYDIEVDDHYFDYLGSKFFLASGDSVRELITSLLENSGDHRQPFNQIPASINYAWRATSWTLTVGKDCCPITPTPYMSTTTHWLKTSTTTTTARTVDTSTELTVAGAVSAQRVAGIAAGIGTILFVVILTIVITVICWCCCRNGKCVLKKSSSSTTEPNTIQRLQSIESRPMEPAEPNLYVRSHPTPINYPTGGSPQHEPPVGHPEPPPPYEIGHPIQPPSYSQVRREVNHPRVEPSAPTLHL